jgi:hypothetical protein
MQNTSHGVMAQRTEDKDSLDDFPTPPWATRALIEHILSEHRAVLSHSTCLEPACGVGHMGYAWLVWEKGNTSTQQLMWVPPCRRILERDRDYDLPSEISVQKALNHSDARQREPIRRRVEVSAT